MFSDRDALCKYNRSFECQSLEDVERFRSMNAPKIAPLCGYCLTGLETLDLPRTVFDQLIQLIHGNDVQFGYVILSALPCQIKNCLTVNNDLILRSKIIAPGNLPALDLKLELVFLVAHQIEERPDLRAVRVPVRTLPVSRSPDA